MNKKYNTEKPDLKSEVKTIMTEFINKGKWKKEIDKYVSLSKDKRYAE